MDKAITDVRRKAIFSAAPLSRYDVTSTSIEECGYVKMR